MRYTLKPNKQQTPTKRKLTTLQGQVTSFSARGGFFHIPHQGSHCVDLLGKTITERVACANPPKGQHAS